MGSASDIGKGTQIDAAVLLNPHFARSSFPLGTYGECSPKQP